MWWVSEPRSKGLIKIVGTLVSGFKVKITIRITTIIGFDIEIGVVKEIMTGEERMITRIKMAAMFY